MLFQNETLIYFNKYQAKYNRLIAFSGSFQSRTLGIESTTSWGEIVLAGIRMREAKMGVNPAMTVPARNTYW
jgi:hypothetical protein